MDSIGLRELRQDASAIVRRVEAGEEIEITVAGRPAARLVASGSRRWQPWERIAGLFGGPPDPAWAQDRDLIDPFIADPWERSR